MSCMQCEKLTDIADFSRPYVVRTCLSCGRKINLRNPGEHGIGIKVEKGDQFVIPAGFLQLSANPLKSSGTLSRHGLAWFAEMVFEVDIASKDKLADFAKTIRDIVDKNEEFFKFAESLRGLDLNDPANADEIFKRLNVEPKTVEWWGYLAAAFASWALNAIEEGSAAQAAWAMAASERFRALVLFKQNFEESVFMATSARRVIDLINIWDSNKENDNESFWQKILAEHSYAISQLFSVPVTFIQGRAYVGGMGLDGGDARFLDFMLSGGAANEAILMEIKTPTTKLLGSKYRKNAFSVSPALTGSIVQVNDYARTLRENVSVAKNAGLEVFNPRKLILIGNHAHELGDDNKRKSFELFRGSLTGIEVITFDEFFRKVEHLAKLFNLVRKSAVSAASTQPASI